MLFSTLQDYFKVLVKNGQARNKPWILPANTTGALKRTETRIPKSNYGTAT
jgi:hypothetical protein